MECSREERADANSNGKWSARSAWTFLWKLGGRHEVSSRKCTKRYKLFWQAGTRQGRLVCAIRPGRVRFGLTQTNMVGVGFRAASRHLSFIFRMSSITAKDANVFGSAPPPGAKEGTEIPSSSDDLALLERLRMRDAEAFSELLDRYHGPLLRLALLFVPSRAVAEEVVQETWVGVLDGLDRFEGRSSVKTWIFRILTNRAKTRGIRENRTVPFVSLTDQEGDHEAAVEAARFKPNGMWGIPPRRWEDDTPETFAMTQQALELLEVAVATLPANQRVVVTLRDIDGLDSDEVCNVLEISETNQRVLLHRARSKLRAMLEEYVEQK